MSLSAKADNPRVLFLWITQARKAVIELQDRVIRDGTLQALETEIAQ